MFATALIVLCIIVAVLLVLVVLPQNPKGGGLSPQMGGVSQVAGTQKTTDILEKITWGFAATVLVLSLVANVILRSEGTQQGGFVSPNEEAAKSKSVGDVAPAPQAEEVVPPTEGQSTPAPEGGK